MILNHKLILTLMSEIKIRNPLSNLEHIIGFKMDCPRCRAWDLFFKPFNQTVKIRCEQCGLELVINIESLVNYSGNILPLNF